MNVSNVLASNSIKFIYQSGVRKCVEGLSKVDIYHIYILITRIPTSPQENIRVA